MRVCVCVCGVDAMCSSVAFIFFASFFSIYQQVECITAGRFATVAGVYQVTRIKSLSVRCLVSISIRRHTIWKRPSIEQKYTPWPPVFRNRSRIKAALYFACLCGIKKCSPRSASIFFQIPAFTIPRTTRTRTRNDIPLHKQALLFPRRRVCVRSPCHSKVNFHS